MAEDRRPRPRNYGQSSFLNPPMPPSPPMPPDRLHESSEPMQLGYWYVVKYGYKAVYSCDQENRQKTIKRAVDAMTDISMLRCFKTYLESTPQLILQLFILIDHGEITLVQYASVLISVSSISWSTVDYQMSLRKSLQGKKGISVGFPMVTYVSYKLFTLTSWILSIVFLLVCNIFIFATLLVSVGLVGLVWVFMQHTHFCKSKGMEYLYRLVAGLIFLFTFFNVKGQKTRLSMSIYYIFRVLSTIVILTLCFYFKPLLTHTLLFRVLSISVVLSLGLGIISLIVYYGKFHPTLHSKDQNIDTVDGFMEESRIEHFIMI
ncbi:XK-related protein 9 [Rhinophrynus dorsalis]